MAQTVPVPVSSTAQPRAGDRRIPWGAVAVLISGIVAVAVVLVLVRRPPPAVAVDHETPIGRAGGSQLTATVPTSSAPPVVLRMATPPPSRSVARLPSTAMAPTSGEMEESAAGASSAVPPEPIYERTVRCSRAVRLKVDPEEAEVEVNGKAIGRVDSLNHDTYEFEAHGVYRLRLSIGNREVWVRVIVEAGADETATIKLDLD